MSHKFLLPCITEMLETVAFPILMLDARYLMLNVQQYPTGSACGGEPRKDQSRKHEMTKARNKAKKLSVFSNFRVFVINKSFHKMQRIHN